MMQDAGFMMHDAGYMVQDTGFRTAIGNEGKESAELEIVSTRSFSQRHLCGYPIKPFGHTN
jgi:hypothetical protein